MRMITSRIFLSGLNKPATKLAAAEGVVKTASAISEAKTANIANLGDYAHPKGKKRENEKDEIIEACDTEASKKPKGKSEKVAEVKVAEEKTEKVETYDAGKKEATEFTNDAKKEPQDAEKPEKNSGVAATTTTKTEDGTFPSSGQPQWEGKPENNNKPEMPTDKNTQASVDSLLKKVLAGLNGTFVKLANLKPELKKDFIEYWRALYGKDYADAMAADK